ncbi:MAG: type II secretion system protein, partial [Pirellulaceae bacterium]
VELLVAIAILGIMAGMALYSLAGAQTDARVARTRGTISKLNEVILQRWEEFRYRPVDVKVPPAWKVAVRNSGNGRVALPYSPREKARVRMIMLRDMMRMELPDRVSDLLYGPTQYTMVPNTQGYTPAKLERPIPTGWGTLYKALYNRVQALKAQGHPNWTSLDLVDIDDPAQGWSGGSVAATVNPTFLASNGSLPEWHAAVQHSELLYLIVASSNYNGSSALEYFRPSEVGDPDDDGLLEFVDAWGDSIVWIRWPAGFTSDLVRYADSDAMDPLRTDWRYRKEVGNYTVEEPWRPKTLVPLILSRGQDGQLGIITDFPSPITYAIMTWPGPRNGTPYGTSGGHYGAGPYYYPDPHFTWDYTNGTANGAASESPYPASNPLGFRANQLGSIPNFIDSAGTIRNEFATDNITNHDIILEP